MGCICGRIEKKGWCIFFLGSRAAGLPSRVSCLSYRLIINTCTFEEPFVRRFPPIQELELIFLSPTLKNTSHHTTAENRAPAQLYKYASCLPTHNHSFTKLSYVMSVPRRYAYDTIIWQSALRFDPSSSTSALVVHQGSSVVVLLLLLLLNWRKMAAVRFFALLLLATLVVDTFAATVFDLVVSPLFIHFTSIGFSIYTFSKFISNTDLCFISQFFFSDDAIGEKSWVSVTIRLSILFRRKNLYRENLVNQIWFI